MTKDTLKRFIKCVLREWQENEPDVGFPEEDDKEMCPFCTDEELCPECAEEERAHSEHVGHFPMAGADRPRRGGNFGSI